MDVFILRGSNWHIRFLVGNISQEKTVYNANSMIFNRNDGGLWAGDYSMYPTRPEHRHSPEECTGWVWVAWQTLVENEAFTIRQWLKFGPNSPVIEAGSNTVSFDELRAFLLIPENNEWFYNNGEGLTEEQAAAWVPSQPVAFQIGKDYSNLIQAKMQSLAAMPTPEELNAIATRTGPASTDWAAWDLEWTSDGPNLLDISGNARNLILKDGGQLYKGQTGPVF